MSRPANTWTSSAREPGYCGWPSVWFPAAGRSLPSRGARLTNLVLRNQSPVPPGVNLSCVVPATHRVVQQTRLDSLPAANALMTTISCPAAKRDTRVPIFRRP